MTGTAYSPNLHSGDARLVPMPPYECWQLLEAGGPIARVVWSGPQGPAIAPVNFTVADGAVWFQTSAESELGQEAARGRVLVEVDHVDPATHAGWSVIVRGPAQAMADEDVPDGLVDLRVWPRGPHHLFIRVAPDELSGRRLVARHEP